MEQASIFEYVEDTHYAYEKVLANKRPIRLFEAFAGIGCQRMALKRLGVEYESIGISEIDKYALKAYEAIHGDCRNYGDITKMTYIPDCDIFTWSFPCTDLSKAGKRAGLDGGTRSGLVYEVLRLLKATEFKPKVLIMENVPDLVQETFKAQFYEIQKELERLGYKNYTRVLNAKDYGIAQNRERVFMVSILGDEHYEFPIPFKLETRLKDYLEENVDEKYYLSNAKIESISKWNAQQKPLENMLDYDSVSPTLTARGAGEEHSGMVLIKEPVLIQVAQLDGKHEESGRVYSQDGLSPTINTCGGGNREPKISEPIAGQFQPADRDYNKKGKQREERFELRSDLVSNAILTGDKKNCIAIPEDKIKGYSLAHDGDGVYINRPEQKRGGVQKGMIQTLKTSCDYVGVVVNDVFIIEDFYKGREAREYKETAPTLRSDRTGLMVSNSLRIRKLTPKECWRLMGITDEYFDRASQVCSNSQLYRQAGNGIVVNVFAEILKGLIEVQNGS